VTAYSIKSRPGIVLSTALMSASHVLVSLFLCLSVSATTVLVVLTPEGIVVAADSHIVSVDIGGYSAPPEGPATKIFVLHDRIAVGTVGFGPQLLTTLDGKPLFSYDPASWLSEIERKTSRDISVRRMVDVIESESHSTFSRLNYLIQSGVLKKEQVPELKQGAVGQYIVCGFDSGIAVVEEVNFKVDWENVQLVGPIVQPIFPSSSTRRFDFGFHAASGGYTQAVDDVLRWKTDSEGFRSVVSEAFVELFTLHGEKDLTLDQASTLLHAILRAQNKYTPGSVGPPYNVVWLLKDRTVHWIKYND
jgi:hypothetical protein